MSDEYWTVGNLMAVGFREIAARHEAEVEQLRLERDTYKAELADLRKAAPGTVTGWTVTEEHVKTVMETEHGIMSNIGSLKQVMDYLRDKAIIAAPEHPAAELGNPAMTQQEAVDAAVASPATIEELAEIGIHAYLSNEQAARENAGVMVEPMRSAVTAILRAARPTIDVTPDELLDLYSSDESDGQDTIEFCNSRIRWTQPVYDAADVEALAKVICEANYDHMKWDKCDGKYYWRKSARAAIAWFGGRVDG